MPGESFSTETPETREEPGCLDFSLLFYFDRNANRHKYSIKSEGRNYTERGACFEQRGCLQREPESVRERGLEYTARMAEA